MTCGSLNTASESLIAHDHSVLRQMVDEITGGDNTVCAFRDFDAVDVMAPLDHYMSDVTGA